MTEYLGEVKLQIASRGFFARVWVHLNFDPLEKEHGVVHCDETDPFYKSEGWVDAAIAGVSLGLQQVSGLKSSCRITRMHCMPVDTNPTLVAIAALKAVWNAAEFQPSAETSARLYEMVLQSRKLSPIDLKQLISRC